MWPFNLLLQELSRGTENRAEGQNLALQYEGIGWRVAQSPGQGGALLCGAQEDKLQRQRGLTPSSTQQDALSRAVSGQVPSALVTATLSGGF